MQINEYGSPAPAPSSVRMVAVYNFKARLTAAERIAIRNAAKTDADVADFLDLLESIRVGVDLDDPMLTGGLAMLVSKSLLTAPRANAIKTAPVLDSERP